MEKRNEIGFPIYDLEQEDIEDFWDDISTSFHNALYDDINENDAPLEEDSAKNYWISVMTDYEFIVRDDTGGRYYFDYNLLSKEQVQKLIASVQESIEKAFPTKK